MALYRQQKIKSPDRFKNKMKANQYTIRNLLNLVGCCPPPKKNNLFLKLKNIQRQRQNEWSPQRHHSQNTKPAILQGKTDVIFQSKIECLTNINNHFLYDIQENKGGALWPAACETLLLCNSKLSLRMSEMKSNLLCLTYINKTQTGIFSCCSLSHPFRKTQNSCRGCSEDPGQTSRMPEIASRMHLAKSVCHSSHVLVTLTPSFKTSTYGGFNLCF